MNVNVFKFRSKEWYISRSKLKLLLLFILLILLFLDMYKSLSRFLIENLSTPKKTAKTRQPRNQTNQTTSANKNSTGSKKLSQLARQHRAATDSTGSKTAPTRATFHSFADRFLHSSTTLRTRSSCPSRPRLVAACRLAAAADGRFACLL